MLSNDLLERAMKFHGHLGPFLILGLKAALLGTHYLGKDYFEVKATVETNPHPPRSCFIDGIQFASGCTTGKGNLEVRTSSNVSVEFVRDQRRIRLTVKDAILNILDQMTSEKVEMMNREILEKTDDELFLIRENLHRHSTEKKHADRNEAQQKHSKDFMKGFRVFELGLNSFMSVKC